MSIAAEVNICACGLDFGVKSGEWPQDIKSTFVASKKEKDVKGAGHHCLKHAYVFSFQVSNEKIGTSHMSAC